MAIEQTLVLLIASGIGLFAALCGGHPERIFGALILIGILLDVLLDWCFGVRTFAEFSWSRFVIDCTLLLSFSTVALKANRIWPLWIAAAQLIAFVGSVAVVVLSKGMQLAYWALTQLPELFELVILLMGTTGHVLRMRSIGPYRSWSPA